MNKTWFDVAVTESYHAVYKVRAENPHAAKEIVDSLVDAGDIDPVRDGCGSYERHLLVDGASEPKNGAEYWEQDMCDVAKRVWSPLVKDKTEPPPHPGWDCMGFPKEVSE